jgi:hypothetical protein
MKNSVASKLGELKRLHGEMIRDNNKQIFLFCLDSFYYQYKIFSMEFEHIKKLRALLNNRMYCDYYKLHNMIVKFCKERLHEDSLTIRSFPVYKDLEPFQEYCIEDISALHESILNLLNSLYLETVHKENSILHYNDNHKVGFSISNFLNTLTHENRILQDQITLYVNYISFFHISQQKQLKRLHHRIADFYKEVDENINMNYTFSIEDIKDDHTIDTLDDILDPADDIPAAPAPSADQSPSQTLEPASTNVSNTLIANPNEENALVPVAVETLPKFKSLSMMIPT